MLPSYTKMSPPTLIFGAGFLGVNFATPSELQELLDFLQKNDIKRIDTARRYPAVNSGRSEQLLGEVNAARQGFTMDTKIKVVGSDASGSLTAAKIKESVAESLEALRVEQVMFSDQRSRSGSKHITTDNSTAAGKHAALPHAGPPNAPRGNGESIRRRVQGRKVQKGSTELDSPHRIPEY